MERIMEFAFFLKMKASFCLACIRSWLHAFEKQVMRAEFDTKMETFPFIMVNKLAKHMYVSFWYYCTFGALLFEWCSAERTSRTRNGNVYVTMSSLVLGPARSARLVRRDCTEQLWRGWLRRWWWWLRCTRHTQGRTGKWHVLLCSDLQSGWACLDFYLGSLKQHEFKGSLFIWNQFSAACKGFIASAITE